MQLVIKSEFKSHAGHSGGHAMLREKLRLEKLLTFSIGLMESLKDITLKNVWSGNADCLKFCDFAYRVFSLLDFKLFFSLRLLCTALH